VVTFREVPAKPELSVNYMQRSQVEIETPNTLEPDRPATCVIAQQYSSATFHCSKEKFRPPFKNVTISFFFLQMRKSEIA
jgi:hypothetical protein